MNSRIYVIMSLMLFGALEGKRHSRHSKIERYERRARESAEKNSPLSLALSKQTKSMTFDQAVLGQKYYQEQQEDDMVIKCGERILAVGGDQDTLRLTRLDLAERFFKKQRYTDAEKHALDYLTYYPGSPESKKASFIALNATYKSQNNSYKDQAKTHTTIELSKTYLEKYPQDNEHIPAVHEIVKKSYLTLVRSELNIITTHMNTYYNTGGTGHLRSSYKRLEYLKEKYLPQASQVQTRVDQLEQVLLKEMKKAKVAPEEESKASKENPKERSRWERTKDFFIEDNAGYFG